MSRRFEGKVALITGAAHGLGRRDAHAHAFAAEGAAVGVADLDADEAERGGVRA